MVDRRQIKSIAERYDLAWQQGPHRLLRLRRRLTWLCALLAAAAVAYPLVMADHRSFQARPLSDAHALYQLQCAQCHDRHGQPLLRLVTGNPDHRSVSDHACRQCHTQQSHDHHADVLGRFTSDGCASCHREHQGREAMLTDVPDSYCLQCHTDLKSHLRANVSATFVSNVPSWAEHPEFALHRDSSAVSQPLAELLAQLSTLEDGRRRDASRLRFNHQRHLAAEGLPVPPGHPDFADGQTWKKLECADCHRPDAAGEYMQPVSYEQHCAACHKLEFSSTLISGGPLPHESADIVRGVLRQRLTDYLTAHPEALDESAGIDRSRLPQTPPPAQPNSGAAENDDAARRWQWVEQQLSVLSSQVVEPSTTVEIERQGLVKRIATGCAFCHDIEQAGDVWHWQVAAPRVPDRWLVHSRFRHAAHTMIAACNECHYGDSVQDLPNSSASSGDILMPSIETCRRCHTPAGPLLSSPSAGTRCVECHNYHE